MKKWEISYSCPSITQNTKIYKAIIRIKHKLCAIQLESELWNVNFCRFFLKRTSDVNFCRFWLKRTSEIIWFLECLQEGFVWSSIFWVFSYQKSTVFMNFQEFLLKFKKNPSKILEELIIFPSFSSSIV